ncbi:putative membrane protein YvbJ [Pseudomonas laurylsulfatiphila]
MKRTVVLTGKAVVNFRKVIEDVDDDEVAELLASNDLREAQIDDDDLLDIEWIHDGVDIKVAP